MRKHVHSAVWCISLFAVAAGADRSPNPKMNTDDSGAEEKPAFRPWGVRYQVKDIERSVEFYTKHLRFSLEQKSGSTFAKVSLDNLSILLSGPKASGSRDMPDGRKQEPGGWNRIVLAVDDLAARVAELKQASVRFRNEIETGPGGKQIQLLDPDSNPVELFEPAG